MKTIGQQLKEVEAIKSSVSKKEIDALIRAVKPNQDEVKIVAEEIYYFTDREDAHTNWYDAEIIVAVRHIDKTLPAFKAKAYEIIADAVKKAEELKAWGKPRITVIKGRVLGSKEVQKVISEATEIKKCAEEKLAEIPWDKVGERVKKGISKFTSKK